MVHLASLLVHPVAGVAQSMVTMFSAHGAANSLHRPIPAREPNPEPNPEPDAAFGALPSCITSEDWYVLFHAVQVRLKQSVDAPPACAPELPLPEPLQLVKQTVLECVQALAQLQSEFNRGHRLSGNSS